MGRAAPFPGRLTNPTGQIAVEPATTTRAARGQPLTPAEIFFPEHY
jgi:hypothetical protein